MQIVSNVLQSFRDYNLMELLSLNDFKFMQGLQAARSFLVHLRTTKE